MDITEVTFAGLPCLRLGGDAVELHVATTLGPRVVGLSRPGGRNVFAELGDLALTGPGGRSYRFVGGHRLWRSPEVPELTYEPDDEPPEVVVRADGVVLAGRQGAVEKVVALSVDGSRVVVDHRIGNRGEGPAEIAPWAITQLVPGGRAVLPLNRGVPPQADRTLVLWPYTDVADPRLALGNEAVVITHGPGEPLKVGTRLDRGWLAYELDDAVFVKRATTRRNAVYPDLGASGQVYVHEAFVELETLGPLQVVSPGGAVRHRETWELADAVPD